MLLKLIYCSLLTRACLWGKWYPFPTIKVWTEIILLVFMGAFSFLYGFLLQILSLPFSSLYMPFTLFLSPCHSVMTFNRLTCKEHTKSHLGASFLNFGFPLFHSRVLQVVLLEPRLIYKPERVASSVL